MSDRFHQHLRARTNHPQTVRPVTLNTWEAIYFDHDMERLGPIIDAAAEIGVERIVLDDGWFTGRRDDTAGLGDWAVDAQVWPQGLAPYAERVRSHGMQVGLWVEPEMVNLDSDLAREHPDWVLRHLSAPAPKSGGSSRCWTSATRVPTSTCSLSSTPC
ncbi:alpha-galactosidase [Ornithinimicrobium sp. INDO-MA30-4]|uniref:alpha-galactosidase n=1 Tax=Ornithinimicrobium sp. INDO-MA30-4 TaxID=2908651 RepID=UPI0021A7EBB8|nr:alpha-galactosidase [Ornithinimicrobium sp. INDO-MA30-4]